MQKLLFIALGMIATLLAVVGVWLPGVPTTIFILIALWAFSRSSPRLHAWLMKIPVLKLALTEAQRFQKEGTVSVRTKWISQSSAWLSFIAIVLLTRSVGLSFMAGLLAIACSVFMLLVPTTHTTADLTK